MALPYRVFSIVPDFSESPIYGVSNTVETTGLSAAVDVAFFPQTTPDLTFAFPFAFTTAAEIVEMKSFFREVGGRLAPFYVPSWREDLPAFPAEAGTGDAGDTKLTVQAEDYSTTHLEGTNPDHYGRQIFIWQPGQDLFTTSVISAEQITDGTVILTLGDYLPFTVDIDTAIIGFCHLAHFDSDDITFAHLTAEVATTEAKFRSSQEYNAELPTLAITQVDRSPFLGFESAVMLDAAALPADSRIAFADTFNAWVNEDGIRYGAGTAYDVDLPDGTGTLSPLAPTFVATDHLSLTWDMDGEHVLAWHDTDSTFTIATGPGDPVSFTITGRDPLLCTNINVDGTVGPGEQTNAVYYRKPNDANLYVRLGPAYGTEYIAAALPVRPIKLKRVIEDLDARTLTVEFLDAQFRTVQITSAPYPA